MLKFGTSNPATRRDGLFIKLLVQAISIAFNNGFTGSTFAFEGLRNYYCLKLSSKKAFVSLSFLPKKSFRKNA